MVPEHYTYVLQGKEHVQVGDPGNQEKSLGGHSSYVPSEQGKAPVGIHLHSSGARRSQLLPETCQGDFREGLLSVPTSLCEGGSDLGDHSLSAFPVEKTWVAVGVWCVTSSSAGWHLVWSGQGTAVGGSNPKDVSTVASGDLAPLATGCEAQGADRTELPGSSPSLAGAWATGNMVRMTGDCEETPGAGPVSQATRPPCTPASSSPLFLSVPGLRGWMGSPCFEPGETFVIE